MECAWQQPALLTSRRYSAAQAHDAVGGIRDGARNCAEASALQSSARDDSECTATSCRYHASHENSDARRRCCCRQRREQRERVALHTIRYRHAPHRRISTSPGHLAQASEYAARAMQAERMAARAESETRWRERGDSQRYACRVATLRCKPMTPAAVSETARNCAKASALQRSARDDSECTATSCRYPTSREINDARRRCCRQRREQRERVALHTIRYRHAPHRRISDSPRRVSMRRGRCRPSAWRREQRARRDGASVAIASATPVTSLLCGASP